MKTWLRLLLVTITVGGGFTGIVLTFDLLRSGGHGPLQIVIVLLSMALYAFVTVSGLLLVHDESRTRPVLTAVALQIPWVSSPVMVYQFASGLHAAFTLGTPDDPDRIGLHFGWNLLFGTHFQFRLGAYRETPSAFGVNAVALALFILLCDPADIRQRRSLNVRLLWPRCQASSRIDQDQAGESPPAVSQPSGVGAKERQRDKSRTNRPEPLSKGLVSAGWTASGREGLHVS